MQENIALVQNVAVNKGMEMNYIIAGSLLMIYSYYDLKERRIPIKGLMVGLTLSVGYLFVNMGLGEVGYGLIWNTLPAIFITLLAFLTRDQIGYGDGAVLLVVGICIGVMDTIAILFIAFFLCSLWGVVRIALKKGTIKSKYAFVPFLTLGFWMIWVMKIWK